VLSLSFIAKDASQSHHFFSCLRIN
jgi:hypothetical protein